MKKVNVGVLGYGFVQATFHLPCYNEIPEAEVLAVGGRRKEKAEKIAKDFGIKKIYSGEDFIEKLCSDSEIDVIDIGLPNFLHQKAAEIAAENQVFIPQITRTKEMIQKGAIGRIFWVRSREAHFGPHSAWFWNPELAGGGVLMDMGCHSVEVIRYLLAKKPVEANAWGATLVHDTKGEDNSLALVRYEDGELGQSENSWAAHGGLDLRYEIYGSDGAVFIDVTRETGIKVFTVAPEEKVGYIVEKAEAKKGWMYPIWREHELYGYLFELQHFISCIQKGEQPRETFKDGYIVNCILDACYRSIKTGKWEKITI